MGRKGGSSDSVCIGVGLKCQEHVLLQSDSVLRATF